MEDKELSQWFDINVQEPWEPGVYEVPGIYGAEETYFSYWCGIGFHGGRNTVEIAIQQKKYSSIEPRYKKWRGLSTNPTAKPKPKPKGNRKVTRYVVMDPNYSLPTPVGTYACKENAQERKQAIPGGYILKIRFRTPEA